jgi:hypothetical protein
VLVLSRKLHVHARLSAGVQPRRCPSAASLVTLDRIRQTIMFSIFVHAGIVFDRMTRNSRLAKKTFVASRLAYCNTNHKAVRCSSSCLRCVRVMLAVSEPDVSIARMLLDCSRLFRTAKTWGRSPVHNA